jgi:hypothetical protein
VTDIVEKLRTDVHWHMRRQNWTIAADCKEAADEIERLRADLALSMETAHRAQKMAAQLLNERAAIAAQPGWQPIETAPEDMNERVVVRWVDSEGEEARKLDYREDGCWVGWHDHAEHVQMIGGHGVSYTPPYEHWMPLPAAPDAPQSHPQR